MLATGMPLAAAAASSLVSVTLFAAATSLNFAAASLIDWRLAGLLLAGGVAGGMVGLLLSRRLANRQLVLRRAFAVMVILVAGYVGWRAVAAL